jgi:hypothetical protein
MSFVEQKKSEGEKREKREVYCTYRLTNLLPANALAPIVLKHSLPFPFRITVLAATFRMDPGPIWPMQLPEKSIRSMGNTFSADSISKLGNSKRALLRTILRKN